MATTSSRTGNAVPRGVPPRIKSGPNDSPCEANKNASLNFQEGVLWRPSNRKPYLHGTSFAQGTVGPEKN
jgi:hypothetical protein